jgi:hypothetical protein
MIDHDELTARIRERRQPFNNACQSLRDTAYEMRGLSRSLRRCGMDKLADEIAEYSVAICDAEAAITNRDADSVSESLAHAERGTANILTAFVAGLGSARLEG